MTDIYSSFAWSEFADQWQIETGCAYLNHGSFGPSPLPVQQRRQQLLSELERQPMQFLIRRGPELLDESLQAVAAFVNSERDNLAFVPNATVAMNAVANNIELNPGDEVLLTDHEYGAVVRIWGQACKKAGARTVLANIPLPLPSAAEVVEALFQYATDKTRVIVVSHITSPTALILPVRDICQEAQRRGIIAVIDGPHAPAMIDVDLRSIGCDFYCASCHKWLSGPFGSGFLYVRSRYKQGFMPNIVSWGRSLQGDAPHWTDEFHWPGTFDPTPYATLPTAIQFLKEIGLSRFRKQTHALAQYARQRLLEDSDLSPLSADSPEYYGSMVTVPFDLPTPATLRPGEPHPLQKWLATEHQLEVPIVEWHQRWHVRVSCHLYNSPSQIDRLIDLLREWKDSSPN